MNTLATSPIKGPNNQIFPDNKISEISGKTYLLYNNNKEQKRLLSLVTSETELIEECQYYSSGIWFEYDNIINTNKIINERLYRKKTTFPQTPIPRPSIVVKEKEKYEW